MTEKTLKSLRFHGLDDVYTIPTGGHIEIDFEGESTGTPSGIDADSLGGILAEDFATKNFVSTEIAKAKLDGSDQNIDLSGYVTKDELRSTAEQIGTATSESVNAAKTEVTSYINEQVKKAASWNLLDNSDFTNPVNQRGLTTYPIGGSANRYTIDRWATINANTTLDVTDDGITMTNLTSDGAGYLRQVLEHSERYTNKTLTLVVETNGKRLFNSGTLPTAFNIKDGDLTVGGVMVSGGKVWVRVWSNIAEDSRTFTNVALYEGAYTANTLPQYVPKGYAHELMECMRYYQSVYMETSGTDVYARSSVINLPVPMRVTPTVTNTKEGDDDFKEIIMVDNKTVKVVGTSSYNRHAGHIYLTADL